MSIKKKKIKVYDMTCNTCENQVEKAIKNLNGVTYVKANFSGQFADVEYDDELLSLDEIMNAIKKSGYSTHDSNGYKFMGILIIVLAIAFLGIKAVGFDMEAKLANASYAVLFLVGILTSIHCVGMCGGIMLTQSLSKESKNKFEAVKPALLYNLGRVASYTILGGIIGAIGSVFSLSVTAKAAMQLIAGIFMIMMGFNMAGFSFFRKFQIKMPHALCKIKNKSGSSFIVGFLNGLMPCGPLQTMQIFALGTGSITYGALSMFVFSIGTVPLMLTFGALSGLLSKRYTKKILKFSGILIIVLGLMMGNRGLALTGINLNPVTKLAGNNDSLTEGNNNATAGKAVIKDGVQTINMTADRNGFTPNAFYVQKGIPVKWRIDGKELNTCNNAIVANSLSLEYKLKSGENIIEFTPGEKDINFSCWMGMIGGVIKVVDKLDSIDTSKPDSTLPPPSSGPSCCAQPIDEGANSKPENKTSIYSNDITKVPTSDLVVKAKNQSFTFTGKGDEVKPLIAVIQNNEKTNLIFDFNNLDNTKENFNIVEGSTGKIITSFAAVKGINKVEFTAAKAGLYGILQKGKVLGLIEAVDNISNADPEKIREKYIK